MPVEVTLGDATWGWRLAGEAAVEAWLRRRPWQGSGSVLAVQAPQEAERINEHLTRMTHAANAATSELRIVPLWVDRAADLRAALTAWMGVSADSWRALALALADDLLVRPTLFMVTIVGGANSDAVFDAASEVVELASKGGAERGPAFVLLHSSGQGPLRGTCRFDRGWPDGLAKECIARPIAEAWRAYVHARIAWETAGILDDASACDTLRTALRLGDDDALERLLGEFARRQFARMPAHERAAWQRLDAPAGGQRTVFGREEAADGRRAPYPWLARALLLADGPRHGVRSLRAELVCRPLAEQVLMTCFLAEAWLRGRIPDTVAGTPPLEAVSGFQRYRSPPSLEAELYPASHPAPPTDAWDFASMGWILPLVDLGSRDVRRLFDRAKRLRNAVAHGHHVGWQAILRAREVSELMGGT